MNSSDVHSANIAPPLCVDLDGTLVHTDLLFENLAAALAKRPLIIFLFPFWLLKGRAYFKERLSAFVKFDPALLPYDDRVVDYLKQERAKGRSLILATASERSQADAIARHLGCFDAVFATENGVNLKGSNKASVLSKTFARFSYLGNHASDTKIWRLAETVGIANAPPRLARHVAEKHQVEVMFPRTGGFSRSILRALRPYQWAKNLLVFIPIITSNNIADVSAWLTALVIFSAFSMVASGVYVLNDLTDLSADRRHPRKRTRPFANGSVPVAFGLVLAPALLIVGLAIAFLEGALIVVGLYVSVSIIYTVRAKELPLVDLFCLTFLYVIRIYAGGLVTGNFISNWLLGFSAFFFLGLAFIKRVTELSSDHNASPKNRRRGYYADDKNALMVMGLCSSFASCVLLALFVQSPEITAKYQFPPALWMLVPLLLFWQLRLWLSTLRGYMLDDPIVYAAKDWVSWVVFLSTAAIMTVAHSAPML